MGFHGYTKVTLFEIGLFNWKEYSLTFVNEI